MPGSIWANAVEENQARERARSGMRQSGAIFK
jgi:muconolactone delta-isomerase